jgi:hypothetical protein
VPSGLLPSHQTLNSGDDIRAALKFAGELVEQEEHHPLPA